MPTAELETSNSFLDDLLSFVESTEVEELEIDFENEGFSIQSMDQANFFARKLKEIREERADAQEAATAQLKAYKEKIDTWLEGVSKPLENQEAYFLRLLEDFAIRKLDGSSKKSLKLIEGTLQFRKKPVKYEYNDEELLSFITDSMPSYKNVKTTVSVDKTRLKKEATVLNNQLYIDGTLVPGVVVTEQGNSFDVK